MKTTRQVILLLLLIFATKIQSFHKECFCKNRIDGYSLSDIQLDFLDKKGKNSLETVMDTLVAKYNSIVKLTKKSKVELPFLQFRGQGTSPRFVFKKKIQIGDSIQDKKRPNTKNKNPTENALIFQSIKEAKRVYNLGGVNFFLYYHPSQGANVVSWNTVWTNEERYYDKKRQIPNKNNNNNAAKPNRNIVFRKADKFKNNLNGQLITGENQPLTHAYTFSHYMASQFEYDVCINFAIFINKMLRKHFNLLKVKDRLTGTPINTINYFLTDERGNCKDMTSSYNVWMPETIVKIGEKKMKKILKQTIKKNTGKNKAPSLLADTINLYKKWLITNKALKKPIKKVNIPGHVGPSKPNHLKNKPKKNNNNKLINPVKVQKNLILPIPLKNKIPNPTPFDQKKKNEEPEETQKAGIEQLKKPKIVIEDVENPTNGLEPKRKENTKKTIDDKKQPEDEVVPTKEHVPKSNKEIGDKKVDEILKELKKKKTDNRKPEIRIVQGDVELLKINKPDYVITDEPQNKNKDPTLPKTDPVETIEQIPKIKKAKTIDPIVKEQPKFNPTQTKEQLPKINGDKPNEPTDKSIKELEKPKATETKLKIQITKPDENADIQPTQNDKLKTNNIPYDSPYYDIFEPRIHRPSTENKIKKPTTHLDDLKITIRSKNPKFEEIIPKQPIDKNHPVKIQTVEVGTQTMEVQTRTMEVQTQTPTRQPSFKEPILPKTDATKNDDDLSDKSNKSTQQTQPIGKEYSPNLKQTTKDVIPEEINTPKGTSQLEKNSGPNKSGSINSNGMISEDDNSEKSKEKKIYGVVQKVPHVPKGKDRKNKGFFDPRDFDESNDLSIDDIENSVSRVENDDGLGDFVNSDDDLKGTNELRPTTPNLKTSLKVTQPEKKSSVKSSIEEDSASGLKSNSHAHVSEKSKSRLKSSIKSELSNEQISKLKSNLQPQLPDEIISLFKSKTKSKFSNEGKSELKPSFQSQVSDEEFSNDNLSIKSGISTTTNAKLSNTPEEDLDKNANSKIETRQPMDIAYPTSKLIAHLRSKLSGLSNNSGQYSDQATGKSPFVPSGFSSINTTPTTLTNQNIPTKDKSKKDDNSDLITETPDLEKLSQNSDKTNKSNNDEIDTLFVPSFLKSNASKDSKTSIKNGDYSIKSNHPEMTSTKKTEIPFINEFNGSLREDLLSQFKNRSRKPYRYDQSIFVSSKQDDDSQQNTKIASKYDSKIGENASKIQVGISSRFTPSASSRFWEKSKPVIALREVDIDVNKMSGFFEELQNDSIDEPEIDTLLIPEQSGDKNEPKDSKNDTKKKQVSSQKDLTNQIPEESEDESDDDSERDDSSDDDNNSFHDSNPIYIPDVKMIDQSRMDLSSVSLFVPKNSLIGTPTHESSKSFSAFPTDRKFDPFAESAKKTLADFMDEITSNNIPKKPLLKTQETNKVTNTLIGIENLISKVNGDPSKPSELKDKPDDVTVTKKISLQDIQNRISKTNKMDISKNELIKNLDLSVEKDLSNQENDKIANFSNLTGDKTVQKSKGIVKTSGFLSRISSEKLDQIKTLIENQKKRQTTLLDLSETRKTRSIDNEISKHIVSKMDPTDGDEEETNNPAISENKIGLGKSSNKAQTEQTPTNIHCPTQTYVKFMDYMYDKSKDENEIFSWMKTLSKEEFEPNMDDIQIDKYLDRTLQMSESKIVEPSQMNPLQETGDVYKNLLHMFDDESNTLEVGKVISKFTNLSQDKIGIDILKNDDTFGETTINKSKQRDDSRGKIDQRFSNTQDITNTQPYPEDSKLDYTIPNQTEQTLKRKIGVSNLSNLSKVSDQDDMTKLNLQSNKLSKHIQSGVSPNQSLTSNIDSNQVTPLRSADQSKQYSKTKYSDDNPTFIMDNSHKINEKFSSNIKVDITDYLKDKSVRDSQVSDFSRFGRSSTSGKSSNYSDKKRQEANSIQSHLIKVQKNAHKPNEVTNPDVSDIQNVSSLIYDASSIDSRISQEQSKIVQMKVANNAYNANDVTDPNISDMKNEPSLTLDGSSFINSQHQSGLKEQTQNPKNIDLKIKGNVYNANKVTNPDISAQKNQSSLMLDNTLLTDKSKITTLKSNQIKFSTIPKTGIRPNSDKKDTTSSISLQTPASQISGDLKSEDLNNLSIKQKSDHSKLECEVLQKKYKDLPNWTFQSDQEMFKNLRDEIEKCSFKYKTLLKISDIMMSKADKNNKREQIEVDDFNSSSQQVYDEEEDESSMDNILETIINEFNEEEKLNTPNKDLLEFTKTFIANEKSKQNQKKEEMVLKSLFKKPNSDALYEDDVRNPAVMIKRNKIEESLEEEDDSQEGEEEDEKVSQLQELKALYEGDSLIAPQDFAYKGIEDQSNERSEQDLHDDLASLEADNLITTDGKMKKLIYDSTIDDFLDFGLIDHRGNPLKKNNPYPIKEYKRYRLEYTRKIRFILNILKTYDSFTDLGIIQSETSCVRIYSDLTIEFSSAMVNQKLVISTLMRNPYGLVMTKIQEIARHFRLLVKAKLEYQHDGKQLKIELTNEDELTGMPEELLKEVLKLHVKEFKKNNPKISINQIEEVRNQNK